MNTLEQSFATVAKSNGLHTLSIAYRGEEFGPEYRFEATGHFKDAAAGQIGCAFGSGETIDAAIRAMLTAVATKRHIALHGDEALMEDAA